ncbi:sensor histidine kinase [Halostreptopolyspora alba]|uniref:histidine kinase n=1 Tax=Halostreptopolyspora alba TaxID=2487137 RepID=A0A3N0EIT7_9ACTN|nr:sensor histidine kinase [Nocardiopsaceae bacterium YIM 96095]
MYDAVVTWTRNHPRVADGAVAGAVFLANLWYLDQYPHAAVGLALTVALCAPYVWRRELPATTFAVMALASVAQWLLKGDVDLFPANLLGILAFYNVAARCRRLVSLAAAGVAEVGGLLIALRVEGTAELASAAYGITILIVSVWIWGYTLGTRRAYLASLQERAVRLERERDNQARIAAAAERARIAREMHDVVSHSLSVMVVQADGAAHSLRGQPDRAERALETISETGRSALSEMRRMLGVLRDGEPEDDSYTPQPGMAQLDQLVADARRSGLPVELTVDGVPRELSSGRALAVYRIVQEALTNTRKHAGPNVSRARVRLWYAEDTLEVRVTDDGRGAAARPDTAEGGGHGLVGMRERVAAYGGSLRSGPRTGGGFEVVASLPLVTR